PVAVDEAKPDATLVASQQRVTRVETIDEVADAIDERLLGVGVMMQMDFDVGDAPVDQSSQRVDGGGAILLFGVEKRVTRPLPGVVYMSRRNSWPAAHPSVDAIERRALVGIVPPRLEMIGQRHPDARDRRSAPSSDLVQARRGIAGQPEVQRAKRL